MEIKSPNVHLTTLHILVFKHIFIATEITSAYALAASSRITQICIEIKMRQSFCQLFEHFEKTKRCLGFLDVLAEVRCFVV